MSNVDYQKKVQREKRKAEANKWARIGSLPALLFGLFGMIYILVKSSTDGLEWSLMSCLNPTAYALTPILFILVTIMMLQGLEGIIKGRKP